LLHAGFDPLELDAGFGVAFLHGFQQLLVLQALGGLAEDDPTDIDLGCYQEEVVEVAQESDTALARALEEVGVEAIWLILAFLAVVVNEGLELPGMGVALLR
jgi:hypothetical protein